MSKNHKEHHNKHNDKGSEHSEKEKSEKSEKNEKEKKEKKQKKLKKSKVNDVELPQIPLPTIEAPTIPIDNLKGEPETSHKNSNRRDASPLEKSPRTLTKPGNPTEKKEKRKSLTRKTGLELKDFMNLSRSGSLGDNELLVTRSKSNSLPTVAAIAKSHHHHHHHGNKKQSPLVAIKSEEPSTLIKAQLSDSSEK